MTEIALSMVLHPISTVEVIETMPPLELSLLLRLLEPRVEEGEKKRMEIRGKYARAFANLSLPRFLVFFSPLRYNCRTTLSLFLAPRGTPMYKCLTSS